MSDFTNKPSTNEEGIADGDRISTSPEERVIEDDQMTNSTSSITPAAFVEDEAMTSSLTDGSRVSRDITLYTLPIGDGDSSGDENTDNDEKDSLEENDVEGEIPPYEALGDDDFGDFIECPVGVMADDIDDSEEVTATIFSPRNSRRCVQPLSQGMTRKFTCCNLVLTIALPNDRKDRNNKRSHVQDSVETKSWN